jgi:hypothetical protein
MYGSSLCFARCVTGRFLPLLLTIISSITSSYCDVTTVEPRSCTNVSLDCKQLQPGQYPLTVCFNILNTEGVNQHLIFTFWQFGVQTSVVLDVGQCLHKSSAIFGQTMSFNGHIC